MQSETLRVLTRLLIAAPLLLACAACAGGVPVTSTPSACSSLLPTEWLEGVEAPPQGDFTTVGDWITYADQAVGQLDKANDRYTAGVGIVSRCEERDRLAVKRSRPKVLGIF